MVFFKKVSGIEIELRTFCKFMKWFTLNFKSVFFFLAQQVGVFFLWKYYDAPSGQTAAVN